MGWAERRQFSEAPSLLSAILDRSVWSPAPKAHLQNYQGNGFSIC